MPQHLNPLTYVFRTILNSLLNGTSVIFTHQMVACPDIVGTPLTIEFADVFLRPAAAITVEGDF
jgi:hypothetical protein